MIAGWVRRVGGGAGAPPFFGHTRGPRPAGPPRALLAAARAANFSAFMAPSALAAPAPKDSIRLVILASFIGTTVEWYDFFLYGTAAAFVFNKLFFPTLSPLAGPLGAYATFAVGFVARPVGGAVFGHYGDRLGRKTMLVWSLLIMGIGTALIGLLPTYATIGVWAPAVLVVLRVAQGVERQSGGG